MGSLPSSITVSEEAGRDFDALFDSGYRRLARLLYRITDDTSKAEEAASEAFWRLHKKPPPKNTSLEGWLYRTGVRVALDQVKKDRRRARYEALGSFLKRGPTPEQALAQQEERTRVRLALCGLKTVQVALILSRAEGLSYSELAEKFHINPASVGRVLARAQEAFRKEYINRYGQP